MYKLVAKGSDYLANLQIKVRNLEQTTQNRLYLSTVARNLYGALLCVIEAQSQWIVVGILAIQQSGHGHKKRCANIVDVCCGQPLGAILCLFIEYM